jgi:hypothetical protein
MTLFSKLLSSPVSMMLVRSTGTVGGWAATASSPSDSSSSPSCTSRSTVCSRLGRPSSATSGQRQVPLTLPPATVVSSTISCQRMAVSLSPISPAGNSRRTSWPPVKWCTLLSVGAEALARAWRPLSSMPSSANRVSEAAAARRPPASGPWRTVVSTIRRTGLESASSPDSCEAGHCSTSLAWEEKNPLWYSSVTTVFSPSTLRNSATASL